MESSHTSEFDFFTFETKIRGIVSELIAPTLRRVTNHEESIDKLIKHDNSAQKRLDELEFLTDKTLKKVITIDELGKSLTELKNQKNTQDANNMFRFESLQTSVDNLNHLFDNILVNFSSLQDSQLGIRSLIEEFKYSFQNDRRSVTEENIKNREEVWNCWNSIRDDWEKFRDCIEDNKRQIVDINENVLPAVNKDVEMLKMKQRELKQKIDNKNEEIEDKELLRLKKQIQKEISVVNEQVVELKDFKNKTIEYIQTQLPMERLHDISESLSVFLGYEDLVSFINYENSKLEKIKTEEKMTIEEIIDKTKNIFEGIDEVRNLRLNNAKATEESRKALLKKESEAMIRNHKSHRSLKNENSAVQIKHLIQSSAENNLPIKEIIEESFENNKMIEINARSNENMAGKFNEDQEFLEELPSNSQVIEVSEYLQNKKSKNRPKRIRPGKKSSKALIRVPIIEKNVPDVSMQETELIYSYQANKSDEYTERKRPDELSFTSTMDHKNPLSLQNQSNYLINYSQQIGSLNEVSANQVDKLNKEKIPKTVSIKEIQDNSSITNPEYKKTSKNSVENVYQAEDSNFASQTKSDTNHSAEDLNFEEIETESHNQNPSNLTLTETDLSSDESSSSLNIIFTQLDDLKSSLNQLLLFKDEMEPLKSEFIFKADFEPLKTDLESTVLFCKASLAQFKSEIDSNFDLFNTEFKAMLKERKQDRYDIQKMISQTQQESRDREKLMSTILSQVENVSGLVASLSEFCRVIHTLMLQDEEDRQSIQLMGYSDSSTPRLSKGVISLKPECVTCTGQNPILLNAFKLACLNYSPTPVKYRYRTYNRRQLIQIMGSFLGNAWNSASAKPPYDSGSFKTLNDSDVLPGSKSVKHRATKSQHIDLPSINTSKLFLDIQDTSRSYL